MMDAAAEDQHSVRGCYVLVVVSEPVSLDHKQLILQRLNKGFLSWDVEATGCDLTGLENICVNVKDNKGAQESDVLIQYSTESLGVEVLVNPPVSTLKQCMKNLLASSIGHKHLIYSGYTFAGSGSWILQNGTFSFNDFLNAFQDAEVHNQKGCSIHVHCVEEGEWRSKNLEKETFSKVAKVSLNPSDRIDRLPGAEHLIDCLSNVLNSHSLDEIMEPSPLVGNVRFNSPTLYVFPSGDGDCSLFGVNGFNMLVDGGFSRKPCCWEFIRHLDRVDAVLVTRLNENNLCGMSTLMKRKSTNNSYPEIGYVFCNIAQDGAPSPVSSEELQKDKNDLLVSIVGEGHKFVHTLNELNLKPHQCWRAGTAEPCVLYHKVGQGTLEMYVLSPPKGSKEVKDFIQEWSSYKEKFSNVKSGLKHKNQDVSIPLSHATSICALVVWRPADPKEAITRILLPGSAPQNKIFESLELLKDLDILKQPTVTKASLINVVMAKPKSKLEKAPTKTSVPNRKNTASPSLSVSSVASRNGDIAAHKKDIKKDNKETKKENREIKKEIKKEMKESKVITEKKLVAKTAPKKVESSPPTAKPTETKRTTLVKKAPTTQKKDATKPSSTAKSSEKSDIKRTPTSKVSDSKTAKEITNKKVAETKAVTKSKPKSSTTAGKVAMKTEKSKASPVTKVTKAAAMVGASIAAAGAAITPVVTELIGAENTEKQKVEKAAEEVQAEAEKKKLDDIDVKEDEQKAEQKLDHVPIPATPPEATSPAPSETTSLTPSDTLSSAPMETVSPTPPLLETASPGEEKDVNEIKDVDNDTLPNEQDVSKLERRILENDLDAEQEHTLIDPSVEETSEKVFGNENNIEKDADDDTLGADNNEHERATEQLSANDMTSSFIEKAESVEPMMSSLVKQEEHVERAIAEETVERSTVITSESVPSTFENHEIKNPEEIAAENVSANVNELEKESSEDVLESEVIREKEHEISYQLDGIQIAETNNHESDEHMAENEIIKVETNEPENMFINTDEPESENEFFKTNDQELEKKLIQDTDHALEDEIARDADNILLPESQCTKTYPQSDEDIDSFLAGATMEGSICAGIPTHDDKDISQEESDFNANNQSEDTEIEQLKPDENFVQIEIVETLAGETNTEEKTDKDTKDKLDSEYTDAFQSEIVVDEISADSVSESHQEKTADDETTSYFTRTNSDCLDEKHTEEITPYVNNEFNDEKHAAVPNEELYKFSVGENILPSQEADFGNKEFESNLMATSLIGETEFGIDERTSESEKEIEDQKTFLDEKKQNEIDQNKQELPENKFISKSENDQFEDDEDNLVSQNASDEKELNEDLNPDKDIHMHLDTTEIAHASDELIYPNDGNDVKAESSHVALNEDLIQQHSSISEEGHKPIEITEAEINLPASDIRQEESTVEKEDALYATTEVSHEVIHGYSGITEPSADHDEITGQSEDIVKKETALSMGLEPENKNNEYEPEEKQRENYAESEDDVDINRYVINDDSDSSDVGRLNVKTTSRDTDSYDEDVVKSPTPHAIVDYEGHLEDHLQQPAHVSAEISSAEPSSETQDLNCYKDDTERYDSENKQDFNEKDRDSAEDDEEMIRHPTPPGEKQFYQNVGSYEEQDMYNEMRDPISQHFVSSPSFRKTCDVIDDPLYEEPEGSDSERLQSPVVEQPVFGNVGEADFPELVNVSGGTTPSEPQSPKFSQEPKHKNNALGVEVMDAVSEHDVDCSETSSHSPLCKDEENIFGAVPISTATEAFEKEKCIVQNEFAGSFEDIKEQVNTNDPDIVNEMTTSGYTLDDISSSVLSSETQCSTVVTSESFSSSVVTSEITSNMQSSVYEQFNDEQEPVSEDPCFGHEKHEQESSKENIQVTHSTLIQPFDHSDEEIENQTDGYQKENVAVADPSSISVELHADYGNEREEISNDDYYADGKHHKDAEEKDVHFPNEENQQMASSYEYSDSHRDDHQTVEAEEEDADLQLSGNNCLQSVSDSKHLELHLENDKFQDVHDEKHRFAPSDSYHPNGHDVEHLLTSEHEYKTNDCPSPKMETKSFDTKDMQSKQWQDDGDGDSNKHLNSGHQFSEMPQSNLKVEQEYTYNENSHFQSVSPEDNAMENDSSPGIPSPTDLEIPFTHISDQKNSLQGDQQNNFYGNENNISHDKTAQDGFSSDNMNFPCEVASVSKHDGRREDPYDRSDSEDEDSSSIPGNVSPYAYTNKAYTQEEEELGGNNIYKQSLRIEQTSAMKSLSFDGNNPQQLTEDITIGSSTTARMTYSPGLSDMSAADPNYDFRLEEWGKPMGLPTPPESAHNLVKKTSKGTTLNKTLNKSDDKRSSIDNGKIGSPIVGSKALSSPSKAPLKKSKSHVTTSNGSPVYVDLAYVPHHGDPDYCDVEFFKKVRARYYVLSGINPSKEVLNALLEAKKSWKENLDVTIIPTYETDTLGYWMAENQDILTANSIEVAPSASRCTVNLQDHETRCSAYRLEF